MEEEKVIPVREFGLQFIKFRRQERQAQQVVMQRKIEADISEFDTLCAQMDAKYRARPVISTINPKREPQRDTYIEYGRRKQMV